MLLKTIVSETLLIKANHTKVSVIIEVHQDEPPRPIHDFDYGSAEANEAELARFESGELVSTYIIVKASACGCQGSDSLGQVCVSAKDFESDVLNIVAEQDMINNACSVLLDTMVGVRDALNEAFKKE